MAKRHRRRFSKLLIVREMESKTTRRYHLTPVRMYRVGVEKREPSYTVGGNVNW